MRKLIMWNVVTVDGYFEGKRAWDLDFHQTVWGDELEEYTTKQLETADMVVYGAKTYHGMAEYWTHATDDPKAEKLNTMPKVVCSTTIETPEWENTVIVRDAVRELPAMKEQGDGNMFVFGSGELSASLMKAGLFDEYRLCVAPVFLGGGKRLFKEGIPHTQLSLLNTKRLKSGGVILWYGGKG
ncbi:MAG TPA: dihydrofolate reductase family protein [Candidatus Saccharimonadales bacterium]|nr:dihydrofolate reductase family protein [Candidatus Saccharimonadales bacterium]